GGERQHEEGVDAQLGDEVGAAAQAGQARGVAAGADDLGGVRVEGHQHGGQPAGATGGDRGADQLLVPAVHPVEPPHDDDAASPPGRHGVEPTPPLHGTSLRNVAERARRARRRRSRPGSQQRGTACTRRQRCHPADIRRSPRRQPPAGASTTTGRAAPSRSVISASTRPFGANTPYVPGRPTAGSGRPWARAAAASASTSRRAKATSTASASGSGSGSPGPA